MLKPRKCRKLLLIITPQLKAAKGKKLFAIDGEWSGKEFIKYVNASPSIRPQLGMVARKLGTIYARHMEKHFGISRKVDWTDIQGKTELPQRQTGQKSLAELLVGKPGFARSKPTTLGDGNIVTRVDFNYHDHIPSTDQKHYFATPVKQPGGLTAQEYDKAFDECDPKSRGGSPFGCGLNNTMMMRKRMAAAEGITVEELYAKRGWTWNPTGHSVLTSDCRTELSRQTAKEGEVLPPELEIKGVHLKQSKLDPSEVRRLVEAYGDIAEKQLIEKFFSEMVTSERDDEAFQKAGRAWLFRMLEAQAKGD